MHDDFKISDKSACRCDFSVDGHAGPRRRKWSECSDASSLQTHRYGYIRGPQSYFNSLNLTDAFGFGTVFYNVARVRNGRGEFVGFADTTALDPHLAFCYVPECYVTHAFKFTDGVKTDLGALPGGASSAPFWINSRGWITGNSQNSEIDPFIPGLPEVRAVLWKGGTIKDLGTLGGSQSFSQAINDHGQITGLALNDILTRIRTSTNSFTSRQTAPKPAHSCGTKRTGCRISVLSAAPTHFRA